MLVTRCKDKNSLVVPYVQNVLNLLVALTEKYMHCN